MKKILVLVGLLLVVGASSGLYHLREVSAQSAVGSSFRYESGMFATNAGDGISVNVENLGSSNHTYRVIVSEAPGSASPILVLDTGTLTLLANQQTHVDYVVLPPGDNYVVEVTTDTDKINICIRVPYS